MTRYVIVTLRVPGFHCWPEAPAEVAFLRDEHRHIFRIQVEVVVTHGDRDVEFFVLQRDVRDYIHKTWRMGAYGHDFGRNSCEHIATQVAAALAAKGYHMSSAEVWEDDENGARVVV